MKDLKKFWDVLFVEPLKPLAGWPEEARTAMLQFTGLAALGVVAFWVASLFN